MYIDFYQRTDKVDEGNLHSQNKMKNENRLIFSILLLVCFSRLSYSATYKIQHLWPITTQLNV